MTGMDDDARLRSETWAALYEVFLSQHERHLESLGDSGVSPGDLKALMRLKPGHGAPMRALAETWRCDASTVTWIVDRLEKQGLVERRPLDGDRRVKVVALSEKGTRLRTKLRDRFYEPPAALAGLSHADLTALHRISARLHAESDIEDA